MATQPNQHNSSPYPLNYSFSGMPELKNMADSIPTMVHDTPAANHDALSMASDANNAIPHNDNRDSGDRQRNNPMHSSDFPPYALPPQQQQQGPYMNPQQQQQRPYMRPPPPYASSSWQPPPQHQQQQQQQQQPDYLTNDSHAGPMRQHYGSEASDYETYVAASQHRPNGPPHLRPAMRPPPPQQNYNQRPPMRPNLRPAMRPPPPGSQYNHSGYPSDSDSSSSVSGGHNKDSSKLGFLTCLKQSFKDIELLPLVPVAGMLGASVYHHYKNRNRGYVVPFKEPQWVRYLGNAMMAHSAYGRLKQHGGHHPYRPNNNNNNNKNSGGVPWGALLGAVAGAAMNRPGFGGGGGGSNYGGYGQQQPYGRPNGGHQSYGRPNGYNGGGGGGHGFGSGPSGGNSGDMVTKVLGKIMGSLFGGGGGNTRPGMGTRDLNSGIDDEDMLGGFDSSSAVQKTVAEHHYRHIYRKQPNLRHTSAQALGGAAAIKVLRSESHMGQELRDSGLPLPADLTHDQMMMGLVLSEVGDLLERKAEVTPLERDDTLENIGKIALATIIKIKMDEDDYTPFPEKQPYTAYNESRRRDYADYDSAQYYNSQSRRHHTAPSSSAPTPNGQPRHHRRRRSESVSESNYAMHGKDSHKYVY
ncbi:hypothetical protein IW146_005505 [Coemansia sp. RSA 922]|nr:hypothetical protein GGI09_001568 [Coemansia sp. S100]KAJ2110311.1 hypothetical protein GGI16_000353 [Coemansia sp. S142-1]KAJ2111227.1 hypothetical protein IW146_005505 [Coemansia sp. RSA 922]